MGGTHATSGNIRPVPNGVGADQCAIIDPGTNENSHHMTGTEWSSKPLIIRGPYGDETRQFTISTSRPEELGITFGESGGEVYGEDFNPFAGDDSAEIYDLNGDDLTYIDLENQEFIQENQEFALENQGIVDSPENIEPKNDSPPNELSAALLNDARASNQVARAETYASDRKSVV